MADSFTNKYLERKRQLTGNSTVTKRTTVPSKSTSSNNHAEGEAVSSSGQGRSSGTSGSSRSGSTDSFTSGYLRRKQELSRPSIAQIDPFDRPQFDSSILPDVSTPNKKASQTSPSRVQQAIQERNYSPLDRANDIIQGALRQWAGGIGSAVGNVLDRTTSRYNSDAADQWLDLVQDSMENRDDENYFERPEVQDRLENIRETRSRQRRLSKKFTILPKKQAGRAQSRWSRPRRTLALSAPSPLTLGRRCRRCWRTPPSAR